MASIDKRPNGKYLARWREFPGGPQKYKQFDLKGKAADFLKTVDYQLLTGVYVAPEGGVITLEEFSKEWTSRRRRKWEPATKDRIARELKLHILPEFGDWAIGNIRKPHIEEWASGLDLAPSTVRNVHRTLSALLETAVDDGRLARNHATKAELPKISKAPFVPLTTDQVLALARVAQPHMRAAVVVAAGTGLRQGELFGLSVDRVDFLRRTLRVDRQLFTPEHGRPYLKTVKADGNSYRTIGLSTVIVDTLAAHLAEFGSGDEGVIFTNTLGGWNGRSVAGRQMREAVERAGIEATWHDFRHHHASLLLSRKVNPIAVAERIGDTLTTLNRIYAHVMPSDKAAIDQAVDEAMGISAEYWLSTGT
jgi:integrase